MVASPLHTCVTHRCVGPIQAATLLTPTGIGTLPTSLFEDVGSATASSTSCDVAILSPEPSVRTINCSRSTAVTSAHIERSAVASAIVLVARLARWIRSSSSDRRAAHASARHARGGSVSMAASAMDSSPHMSDRAAARARRHQFSCRPDARSASTAPSSSTSLPPTTLLMTARAAVALATSSSKAPGAVVMFGRPPARTDAMCANRKRASRGGAPGRRCGPKTSANSIEADRRRESSWDAMWRRAASRTVSAIRR